MMSFENQETPTTANGKQRLSETILVTGGAGFIGSHLCASLIRLGHNVIVIDLKIPELPITGVRYVQGDVQNSELLAKLISEVSTVYHFAATVSVPLCQMNPVESYSNNFISTLNVLEALRTLGGNRRLVFASTAALYGNQGDDGHALREEDTALQFNSFYAAQKHASEQALALYRVSYGINSIIFRFFNVFGEGQDPSSPYSGVITLFTRLAEKSLNMPLNDGGTQTRDFISVRDIVSACTTALSLPSSAWDAKPINLGSGRTIEIRQLAEMVRKIYRASSELVCVPARDGDVRHSRASIQRAKTVLDFAPNCSLEEGLAQLYEIFSTDAVDNHLHRSPKPS